MYMWLTSQRCLCIFIQIKAELQRQKVTRGESERAKSQEKNPSPGLWIINSVQRFKLRKVDQRK